MKDKIKDILGYIVVGVIILLAISSYPWRISVNNYGETVCKNLFGQVVKCR